MSLPNGLSLQDRLIFRSWLVLPSENRTRERLRELCQDDAQAERIWAAVGEYRPPPGPGIRIERPIARGATATVYRAVRDDGRAVAVKHPLLTINPEQLERFRRDAAAVRELDHPNVVRLEEIRADAQPYIVMELADRSLDALLRERRDQDLLTVPPKEAAALVRDLAGGAAYIHGKSVYHRDIKPGNILLFHSNGSPPSDPLATTGYIPKLADFGCARFPDSKLTLPLAVLGTPAYMAPEQADGDTERVGPAADVYALGALLYEMLTGRPPFVGDDAKQVLRQVLRVRPQPVRQANPDVPVDLETVCMRCLEKSPENRFRTADELRAELERFCAGQRIRSRPPGRPARIGRWVVEHPRDASAIGAIVFLVAVLIAGLAWGWLYYLGLNGQLREEIAEKEVNQYTSSLARAEVEILDNRDIDLARRLLSGCPTRLCGWEHSHLRRRIEGDGEGVSVLPKDRPPDPTRGMWMAVASPDGEIIAAATINEGVRLFSTDGNRQLGQLATPAIFGQPLPVYGIAFSPDGKTLAVATQSLGGPGGQFDHIVQLWEVPSRALVRTLRGHTSNVHGLAFRPDGLALASCGYDRTVRLWDPATGQNLKVLEGHTGWVNSVAYNPSGTELVSVGADGQVRVWNAEGGLIHAQPKAHGAPATGVAFEPTGHLFATCGMDGAVRIWDAHTRKLIRTLLGHLGPVLAVAFTPDGNRLVSAGFDRTLKVWDYENGRLYLTLRGHADLIWSVDFVSRGPATGSLISTGFDATVRVWRPAEPPGTPRAPVVRVGGTANPEAGQLDLTNDVAFTRPGDRYAVSWWDGRVTIHGKDDPTGRQLRRGEGPAHDGPVWRLSWTGDGCRLATASWDGTVRVWNPATGELMREIPAGTGAHSVAFAPDGRRLVVGTIDGKATVWDVEGGVVLFELTRPLSYLTYSAAWSPDGRFIATGGFTPGVFVWNGETGELVTDLGRLSAREGKFQSSVYQLAFSGNGEWLAGVSWDKQVLVWRVPKVGEQWVQSAGIGAGHTDYACTLAFSPDGATLATGGLDKRIQFWKVRAGGPLEQVGGSRVWGQVWGIAWDPTLRRLLVADWDRGDGVKSIAPP